MAESSQDPSDASPFGRYVLDELIARGGMGEVFRAVAVGAGGFEKPVVVKRILPSLGGVASMSDLFVEEARLMSRLVHPNIVQVIDFGQGENDDYFLVMELVDGVDLRLFGKAFSKRGESVPIGVAAFIVMQTLRGLSHAHNKAYRDGRTLVHRDVSPGNVLLSRVGEVKVADFGVALVAVPDGDGPRTIAGKPGYMAPEQTHGDVVDGRADLFSVGVVLFRLLTGESAFVGDDQAERQESATLGRVRDLEALRPEAGPLLAAVIKQALTPDPDQRFVTARAMSKAIEAACRESDVEVASADDLAEHVERIADARAREPKAVVAQSERSVVKELTRTGAFTMKVTKATGVGDVTNYSTVLERSTLAEVSAEPRKSSPEIDAVVETPPTVPLASSRKWLWLAVALTSVSVLWWSTRDASLPSPVAPVETARRAALPPSSLLPSSPPSVTRPVPSTTSAPLPPNAATSVAPRSTSRVTPPPSHRAPLGAPPTTSAAPSPSCQGKVLLSSKGSWWVSGGPGGRVQSPGVYSWRCGSYALTGKSRVDGKVVSRGVSVRDGATASARFE